MTAFISSLAICAALVAMIWLTRQFNKCDKPFFEAKDRRRRGIFDD